MSASTSATDPSPSSSSARQRPAAASSSSGGAPAAEYTAVQVALVKKVRGCKRESYYEILAIEKSADENAIKKGYRKMALGLHPDKNKAPGADEAFKMVSKAFTVLSDPQKRAVFDQTGRDPDSRGGGGGGGGFGGGGMPAGFRQAQGFGGGGFGEEITPEDLFRAFFGGGGGGFGQPMGGGFGGNGATFQFFGPGGVRMTSHGMGGRPRAPGQQGQDGQPTSLWVQLAPLLILFLFSALSSIPSLFGTSPPPDPDFSWSQTPTYSVSRTTSAGMGVQHFVNAAQIARHPIFEDLVAANSQHPLFVPVAQAAEKHAEKGASKARAGEWVQHILKMPEIPHARSTALPTNEKDAKASKKVAVPKTSLEFDRKVERAWVHHLQVRCQEALNDRAARLEGARGFFGLGADREKVKSITNERPEACTKLAKLGYNVQY